MTRATRQRISAVMPVLDGRAFLEQSLRPLIGAEHPALLEVIVVDDGSTDGSGELARGMGALVVPSGGTALGPARCRNIGASHAGGDLLLFVDADVVLHPDALARLAEAFEEPETSAVYGSYDDSPPCRGFASLYMNLRHHFMHRVPARDSATFWSGLGAVRRDLFLEVGGFDAESFPKPSVEDIELGWRIHGRGGRIRRVPEIRGKHLKAWSLAEVVRTDIFRRALPWARLMQRNPGAFADLNVSLAERGKALLAVCLLASLVAAALAVVPPWVPVLLLASAFAANRELASVFLRGGGFLFAVGGVLFNQVHYAYSTAVYGWSLLEHRLRRSS